MNTFKYLSSNHSSGLEITRDRISYYLDINDFNLIEDSGFIITFQTSLAKSDVIKLDAAMSSLGYVRP